MTELTQHRLKELFVYNPLTGIFTRLVAVGHCRSGTIVGSADKNGHLRVKIFYKDYFIHRLAWLYMTGIWPKAEIDHENLERSDNRWTNLREATQAQNAANRPKLANNTSGRKGVAWRRDTQKWQAQISFNGRSIHIGVYTDINDAAFAYALAAQKYHGEFARDDGGRL